MENETDYERLRIENIKRNTEFLESIGIDNVKVMMKPKQSSSSNKRGIKRSVVKTKSLPARRSSRITILSLQNMMEEAKETGNTALLQEAESKLKLMDIPVDEQPYQQLAEYNHVANESVESERIDDGFMELLEQMEPFENQQSLIARTAEYSKLTLMEDHVAKVTKSRITVTFVHPSTSKVLIAAGDKEGYLGLWAPDDNDVVSLSKPHRGNICSIFVNPMKSEQLWSASYDCTLKYTNVEHRNFVQQYQVDSEGYVTDATHNYLDYASIYVSLSSGDVQMVDIRAPSCQWTSQVHEGLPTSSYDNSSQEK